MQQDKCPSILALTAHISLSPRLARRAPPNVKEKLSLLIRNGILGVE